MEWFTDMIVYYDLETGDPNLLVTFVNMFGLVFAFYFVIEVIMAIGNAGKSMR